MMGSETHPDFYPPSPREEMESLALADDPPSEYRSAAANSFHPLSAVDGGDPLLSPSSPVTFIDPPAYADVVFSPYESSNGGDHSPSASLRRKPSIRSNRWDALEYVKITVSDPEKETEPTTNSLVPGTGTYVSYLITTRDREGYETRVRRRFRNVVTLADRLAEAYRGFIIPPRPDKNVVESQVMQKQDFVEQRRSALEKYLWRLALHPIIGRSDELRVFLRAQGKLPMMGSTDVASRMLDRAVRLPKQLFGEGGTGFVVPEDVVKPAKGGRNLLRIFKELKQSVVTDWGGVKPLAVEEDKEFLEKKDKVHDLEQQISSASQQAEALVKAQQDMGETMGELGLAFMKMTKFETEEAIYDSQRVRAADMKQVATAAVKASRFYRELNSQTVKNLDTLHEYLGLMLTVHNAFSDRSSALLTVQTLLSDLSYLQARAEKLEAASLKIFGGDKSRIRKVEELKETIKVNEDAKYCVTREYERIKENNRNELERLDRERKEDFVGMLKGFVINQVAYNEKIANVWAKVAEETSGYAGENNN